MSTELSRLQRTSLLTEESSENPPPEEPDPTGTTVATRSAHPVARSAAAPSPQSDIANWNDWQWQIRNRIRRIPQLKRLFPKVDEAGLLQAMSRFPMAITPYYASLIKACDNTDPVFRQCVPQIEELIDPPCLKDDPLEEDEDSPVPGLVHRYSDRGLLIATSMCSTYCRHCTRKRVAGQRESSITSARLKRIVQYLESHPEVHDVVISGGDPLTMPTSMLEQILTAIRSVASVDIIRIGTRTPVVLPMRITDELVNMLKQFHPLFINTHFNHPIELTREAIEACGRLVDAGIPVSNQTVLLRGVNDDPLVMEQLCRQLIRSRIRPYYMFQCDLVRGIEHFRTPLSRGTEIMEYLRGRLSGLAIPTFVVDAPHGGGKIPVTPNYIISASPTHTVLRNFEGMLVSYPEPQMDGQENRPIPSTQSAPGVWELTRGAYSKIQPQNNLRSERRLRRSDSPPAAPERTPRSEDQSLLLPGFDIAPA